MPLNVHAHRSLFHSMGSRGGGGRKEKPHRSLKALEEAEALLRVFTSSSHLSFVNRASTAWKHRFPRLWEDLLFVFLEKIAWLSSHLSYEGQGLQSPDLARSDRVCRQSEHPRALRQENPQFQVNLDYIVNWRPWRPS